MLCTVVYCSLKLYNNLVEKCFKDCVLDFRSKNLAKDEQQVGSVCWQQLWLFWGAVLIVLGSVAATSGCAICCINGCHVAAVWRTLAVCE
jgi:hypothetical protein